jgi:hypothetical protein
MKDQDHGDPRKSAARIFSAYAASIREFLDRGGTIV